jgi:hypothetical protein
MDGLGSQFLDVALGLALIFLVLSLVCSLVQELLAVVLSWRAKFLEKGLRTMLDREGVGLTDSVLRSPFVEELLKPHRVFGKNLKVPAYLPSSSFARAVVDRLKMPLELPKDTPEPIRRKLEALVAEAGNDVSRFRASLEEWFDASMDRVSAWYKRRARIVLFCVGVPIAAFTNADLTEITSRLWRDDAVRAAVVAHAERVAQAKSVDDVRTETRKDIEMTGDLLAGVKQLDLPLWWNDANGRVDKMSFSPGKGQESWFAWAAGVLLTSFALSFGAPFWFNLLSRLARFRGGRTATARE